MPRRSRRAPEPAPVRFPDSCRFVVAPSGEAFADYGRALAAVAGDAEPATVTVRSPFGVLLPVPTDAHGAEVASKCWDEHAHALGHLLGAVRELLREAAAASAAAKASAAD